MTADNLKFIFRGCQSGEGMRKENLGLKNDLKPLQMVQVAKMCHDKLENGPKSVSQHFI